MQSLLPSGYTPLAYIENTGSSYIDTGWKYDNGTVSMNAEYTIPSNNDATVFGSSNDNTKWLLLIYRYGNNSGCYCGSISGGFSSSLPEGNKRRVHYEISGTTCSFNDGYQNNSGSCGTIPSQSYNYTVFCHNYGGSKHQFAKCRVYYLNVVHKGNLVVDLRPARRDSDGAIGMYDLVSKTFKTNAGSGTFIAGP